MNAHRVVAGVRLKRLCWQLMAVLKLNPVVVGCTWPACHHWFI